MLSNKLSTPSPDLGFLPCNAEAIQRIRIFAELSEGFTIGFVEVNRESDRQLLVQTLCHQAELDQIQWVEVVLKDPSLTNVLSELSRILDALERQPDRKLVLLMRGLEQAIGQYGDYPEILAKMNLDRDSFNHRIPHPILFLLPSAALTRFARFAPDFWDWRSTVITCISTSLNTSPEELERIPVAEYPWTDPVSEERLEFLYYYLDQSRQPNLMRADLLAQLGQALLSRRETIKAEQALQEALNLYEQLDKPLTAADTLTNLAITYRTQARYQEAKSCLQKAIATQENQLGPDHATTAVSYSNLATVLYALGEYEGAKQLLQKAMASAERNFGPEHPTTAGIYSNLAGVLKDLGEYEGAKQLLQKAMASAERNFGPEHPTTALSYHNLSAVLQDLGAYESALDLSAKALRVFEATLPADHPYITMVKKRYQWIQRSMTGSDQ